jgi:hypothetical protein
MAPDELTQLEAAWDQEREKYVTWRQGIRHEPMDSSVHLIMTIGWGAATCLVAGVSFYLGGLVQKGTFLSYDAFTLVLAGLTMFNLRQFFNSRRYEQARKDYLRKRAEIKAKSQAGDG